MGDTEQATERRRCEVCLECKVSDEFPDCEGDCRSAPAVCDACTPIGTECAACEAHFCDACSKEHLRYDSRIESWVCKAHDDDDTF